MGVQARNEHKKLPFSAEDIVLLTKWLEMATSMNWVSVVSTVFILAAYDEDRCQLFLNFHGGKVYRYFEFPSHQYDEFLAAESQGKYFSAHIRGKYRDEEVREAHGMAC